jgi:hypothetical protein
MEVQIAEVQLTDSDGNTGNKNTDNNKSATFTNAEHADMHFVYWFCDVTFLAAFR